MINLWGVTVSPFHGKFPARSGVVYLDKGDTEVLYRHRHTQFPYRLNPLLIAWSCYRSRYFYQYVHLYLLTKIYIYILFYIIIGIFTVNSPDGNDCHLPSGKKIWYTKLSAQKKRPRILIVCKYFLNCYALIYWHPNLTLT